ncbi:MAG: T9SS type A sorting domain-containing protein [Salibacteraceae bacterium]
MKTKIISLFSFLLLSSLLFGQTKKVLFVGNSYTGANNLPQMFEDVSTSTGDTVLVESITPGGYRFLNHSSNPATLTKIASNDWDYVALQAQSQEPSWPIGQVQQEVFPHAAILCDSIRANNSCSMPMFYMTWGRKNGDANNCASWPPVCTYQGMDSLLSERYQTMADDNNAIVSPVGAVWKYIRTNNPTIELYSADESHPSLAGTYAAACTFFVTVFRKDPTFITFQAGLPSGEALAIREAAKMVVFDNLSDWNIGNYDPVASFSYTQVSATVDFSNSSSSSDEFLWFLGDGDTTSVKNPVHTYASPGDYYVTLEATKCGRISSITDTIVILNSTSVTEFGEDNNVHVYPNPTSDQINVDLSSLSNFELLDIVIFNELGKTVKVFERIRTEKFSFSVNEFPIGVYFLKARIEDRWLTTYSFQIIR